MAEQFRETVELYQQLLVRLNFTLEGVAGGGVNPTLLAIAEEYRRMLQGLLERAINATIMLVHCCYDCSCLFILFLSLLLLLFVLFSLVSERELTSEHMSFEQRALSLQGVINEFSANLTNAESSFLGLRSRLESARSMYDTLRLGVANLESAIQLELRQLLGEAMSLRLDLRTQVSIGTTATCKAERQSAGWLKVSIFYGMCGCEPDCDQSGQAGREMIATTSLGCPAPLLVHFFKRRGAGHKTKLQQAVLLVRGVWDYFQVILLQISIAA